MSHPESTTQVYVVDMDILGIDASLKFRKPAYKEVRFLLDHVANGGPRMIDAMESVVRGLAMGESRELLQQLSKEYPGIYMSLYKALFEKVGLGLNFTARSMEHEAEPIPLKDSSETE